jgi:hypothetical protein
LYFEFWDRPEGFGFGATRAATNRKAHLKRPDERFFAVLD